MYQIIGKMTFDEVRQVSITYKKTVARQMFYCLAKTEEWVHKQRGVDMFKCI